MSLGVRALCTKTMSTLPLVSKNQRDMDIPDFVSYFAQAPGVDAVALYVESIRDGALFAEAVRELHAAGKHLVAYLGGRNAAGEAAAASHTGKIVGRGALEEGLLRDLGVVVVDDPDDLWVLGSVLRAPGTPCAITPASVRQVILNAPPSL